LSVFKAATGFNFRVLLQKQRQRAFFFYSLPTLMTTTQFKFMKPFFLLALCLLMMGSCNKDKIKYYEDVLFQFEMPFSINPVSMQVKVGDTLTISAAISDSLFDVRSKQKYYLPDFGLDVLLIYYELNDKEKSPPFLNGATSAFDFIIGSGAGGVVSEKFVDLYGIWHQGTYKYSIKFIAKRTGVFSIRMQDLRLLRRLPQYFAPEPPGWQRVPMFKLNKYIINNGNTHFDTYVLNAKPLDPDPWLNEADYVYTFVVTN
jgi:hypothetical protein